VGKRMFDLIVGGLALLLTAPAWVPIATAIKLDSGGPILYRSKRVGRFGLPFDLYKFRTMLPDSEGPRVTSGTDSRITRVGRTLRNYKLDELPQFLNVLKGDMSIVGPRPEDPVYVSSYTPEQMQVLSVRPGLFSPAIIKYRNEEAILSASSDPDATYRESILPDKLRMDIDYLQNRSLWGDAQILARGLLHLVVRPRRRDDELHASN
jgi:lipopolysaccharide/colanic/teichoic acid biosynthesis glycosyltransferase